MPQLHVPLLGSKSPICVALCVALRSATAQSSELLDRWGILLEVAKLLGTSGNSALGLSSSEEVETELTALQLELDDASESVDAILLCDPALELEEPDHLGTAGS